MTKLHTCTACKRDWFTQIFVFAGKEICFDCRKQLMENTVDAKQALRILELEADNATLKEQLTHGFTHKFCQSAGKF